MTKRGGKRKGAGRKPLPQSKKKQVSSYKFATDIREYLNTTANKTATIETAIRESKGFKAWHHLSAKK